MSDCLRSCSSHGREGHFLPDLPVNLNGWADDIDKMQVSPRRNLWYDTDAVSTRLTPHDPQCEQKLSCSGVVHHCSAQPPREFGPGGGKAEWENRPCLCEDATTISLFFFSPFLSLSLPPSLPPSPFLQADCCSTLCTLFKGCRLETKIPSHLYP